MSDLLLRLLLDAKAPTVDSVRDILFRLAPESSAGLDWNGIVLCAQVDFDVPLLDGEQLICSRTARSSL